MFMEVSYKWQGPKQDQKVNLAFKCQLCFSLAIASSLAVLDRPLAFFGLQQQETRGWAWPGGSLDSGLLGNRGPFELPTLRREGGEEQRCGLLLPRLWASLEACCSGPCLEICCQHGDPLSPPRVCSTRCVSDVLCGLPCFSLSHRYCCLRPAVGT